MIDVDVAQARVRPGTTQLDLDRDGPCIPLEIVASIACIVQVGIDGSQMLEPALRPEMLNGKITLRAPSVLGDPTVRAPVLKIDA